MSTKIKIILFCLVLAVVWVCIGIFFINFPPNYSLILPSNNSHYLPIIDSVIGFSIFVFWPISLLIFPVSRKMKVTAVILLILTALNFLFFAFLAKDGGETLPGFINSLYYRASLTGGWAVFGFLLLLGLSGASM